MADTSMLMPAPIAKRAVKVDIRSVAIACILSGAFGAYAATSTLSPSASAQPAVVVQPAAVNASATSGN